MITTNIQRHGTVLVSVTGPFDESAGPALQRARDRVTVGERGLMVDLHGAESMDVKTACSTSWPCTGGQRTWACASWSSAGSPSPSNSWPIIEPAVASE
ncbi:hypothetical protein OG590_39180 (plasmid) [Streptomyces goshikiensis]|uniref:hypothetical protein n=1 Tax=Streptomyces goshikiensis TaxID=1942 RepID=UPI002F912ED7|nr:hypothetical protein OG590_39180 [Streptomyces goshikiensis]